MTLFVSEFGFRIWISIELSIQKRSGSIFACVNVRFVWHFSGDLLRNWLKSLKLFSVLVLLINMRLISMHKHTSSKEKTKFTSFKNCICKYRHLELKCERYISPLNGISHVWFRMRVIGLIELLLIMYLGCGPLSITALLPLFSSHTFPACIKRFISPWALISVHTRFN